MFAGCINNNIITRRINYFVDGVFEMSEIGGLSREEIKKPKLKKAKETTEVKLAKEKVAKEANIKKLEEGKEEIDDLFDQLSKKRTKANEEKESKKKHKSIVVMRDTERDASYGVITSNQVKQIISPDAPVHRFDRATGLPVYKAHLLKVGEGGGTPLCPFDCDCCF